MGTSNKSTMMKIRYDENNLHTVEYTSTFNKHGNDTTCSSSPKTTNYSIDKVQNQALWLIIGPI